MNKIENFLKSINHQKLAGSKLKLAKALGISSTSVSKWCSGKAEPSIENIEKMAKIFNRTQEEIVNIFILSSDEQESSSSNKILLEEIKLLKQKIKFLETQIDFYKEKLSNVKL